MLRLCSRNPFQGGMGFFTRPQVPWWARVKEVSQSLSGWDGVFHSRGQKTKSALVGGRNPFQGGMGFFTNQKCPGGRESKKCRNPFQGGMGFFTLDRG